jgi:type II secretory pathway pseudopilin PulG
MSGERGETTLVGLLVAMVLFGAVFGATLELYSGSERVNHDAQQRVDAEEGARQAEEMIARELRSLASPTPSQPRAVDRAGARDLVFKTVDAHGPNAGQNAANVKRVRYCLDGRGRLLRMEQRWTSATVPAVPGGLTGFADDATCSTTGWDGSRQVADSLVNYAAGKSRALFAYNSQTDLTAITSIAVSTFVDVDATKRPPETNLTTGVYLRNQNRAPTATVVAKPSAQGLLLNGSLSTDPEGDILTYCWYDSAAAQLDQAAMTLRKLSCTPGPLVGTGITFLDPVPYGSARTIWLEVRDPGDLSGVSAQQSITNQS